MKQIGSPNSPYKLSVAIKGKAAHGGDAAQAAQVSPKSVCQAWLGAVAKMEETVSAQKTKEKSFRVLVVDDEEDIGILFQRLLGGTQEVIVARDGYEALEKAKEQSFDLVFLDVRLPGMDGVETLEQLKEILPDAIVVMMSGYSVEDEVRRALDIGAQDFIAKPFKDPDQIMTIEQVARYLSLHELTVRRLAREGEIPAFKVGRQWRVKKALLDRWIEREASRHHT